METTTHMGIKIIKDRKATDYTFTEDSITLGQPAQDDGSKAKKGREAPRDFRLKENTKINRLKKSRMTGGHGMQGHSPVYE